MYWDEVYVLFVVTASGGVLDVLETRDKSVLDAECAELDAQGVEYEWVITRKGGPIA